MSKNNEKGSNKNNGKSSNNQNMDTKSVYPSSKVLLEIIKSEYGYEKERGRNFENKASMLITLMGAIIAFLPSVLSKINVEDISNMYYKDIIVLTIVIFLTVIMIVLITIDFILLTKIISCKKYIALKLNGFTEKNAKAKEGSINVALMEQYTAIIKHNRSINDIKANKLNQSIWILVTALTIMMIITFISLYF